MAKIFLTHMAVFPILLLLFLEGERMKKRKTQCPGKLKYFAGKRILPDPISAKTGIAQLIDNMDAYNGGRLRAACQLLKEKYSKKDVTVGMSLAGALTPAGLDLGDHPADESRFCRLDNRHRCEHVPRSAFCLQSADASGLPYSSMMLICGTRA